MAVTQLPVSTGFAPYSLDTKMGLRLRCVRANTGTRASKIVPQNSKIFWEGLQHSTQIFFRLFTERQGGDLLHIPCHIRRLDLRTFGFCFVPSFLPRDAMQAQPMSSRGVSVCVRLSRLYILSKRINISSIFLPSGSQAILVCPHQSTKRHGDIPTRTRHPNGSVECRLGRQKSRF